jgi:hypothetical protein
MMKRTILALCAVAAMTAVSASVASAQDVRVGPGGMSAGRDQGFRNRGDNCRLVITHRRGPNGSVTVRRRICD